MRLISAVAAILLVAGVALARAASAGGDAAPGWGLDQLMHGLAAVKSSTAHFVERKYLKILDRPLETTGTLVYVAPSTLQKNTLGPKPERLIVEGGKLTMIGGSDGQSRTLSLEDSPEIAAFVESIRATLAGDLPALRRFYDVGVTGTPQEWTLLLVPKDPKVRDLVTAIRISGSGHAIRRIDSQETDGDRDEMTVFEDTQ